MMVLTLSLSLTKVYCSLNNSLFLPLSSLGGGFTSVNLPPAILWRFCEGKNFQKILDIFGQNDINGTLVFTNNNEDDIDGTIDWSFIMTKEYYIYVTTNNINGKKYIGQHKGKPEDSYFGSGTTITKALNKYGKENFSKEILCFCDTRKEADEKEKYYIDFYDAINDNNYYNNAEGGNGGDG